MKKRVLFVDDEPNIIGGLKRMLRKHRDVWDMEFATSSSEALAKLAQVPYDVLVTDIQMPIMSGAELLERVVEAYPCMARIVLSGHVDEKVSTRVVGLAHRFLAKPTDAETLFEAVNRACDARETVTDDRARSWVASCRSLPTLPTLYVELTQAANSETSDARSIAAIITRDMAISAKLLQLVNSSFFGLARRISSIERTVAMLGLMRIRGLILTDHVFRKLMPGMAASSLSVEHLWSHSCLVAETARRIAKFERQENERCDQAFTAGLLHDIGLLLMATQAPQEFDEILRRWDEPGTNSMREREIVGLTHGQIGAHLLELWGLPPRIVEAVRLHHEPFELEYDGLCAVTWVHVADALMAEMVPLELDSGQNIHFSRLETEHLERRGLSSKLEPWRDIAAEVTAEFATEVAARAETSESVPT